jgi:hypothetical protein
LIYAPGIIASAYHDPAWMNALAYSQIERQCSWKWLNS